MELFQEYVFLYTVYQLLGENIDPCFLDALAHEKPHASYIAYHHQNYRPDGIMAIIVILVR